MRNAGLLFPCIGRCHCLKVNVLMGKFIGFDYIY